MPRFALRRLAAALVLLCVSAAPALAQAPAATGGAAAPRAITYPAWAYPWDPGYKAPAGDDQPQRLPGSTVSYSVNQSRDLFSALDWYPQDHGPMPEVVARGRKPDVRACGACHRAEGTGGPENASLAGLPAAYFVQQMADFKSGARKLSAPVPFMLAAAKAVSDEEVQAAAAYFAALKPKQNIKVVESDTAPKTYIARLFFAKSPEGGSEPLGRRIVEVPDDVTTFELRDSRAQFTAYVPVGSVARGAALAKAGTSGTNAPCASCHGADLKGVGPIPSIAGRSPSYIVRQLYDFKHGARTGSAGAQMLPTVEKLTEDDIIALAAYLASLAP